MVVASAPFDHCNDGPLFGELAAYGCTTPVPPALTAPEPINTEEPNEALLFTTNAVPAALNVLAPAKVCVPVVTTPPKDASAGCNVKVLVDMVAPLTLGAAPMAAIVVTPPADVQLPQTGRMLIPWEIRQEPVATAASLDKVVVELAASKSPTA